MILFAVFLFPASPGSASEAPIPKIAETQWRFIPEQNFVRISEYFTGRENTAQRVIRRSQPERTGYYLIVRFDRRVSQFPTDAQGELRVILPGELEARLFVFPLHPVTERGTHLYLGITGSDWTGGEQRRPLAWELLITSPSEAIPLAQKSSFLWQFPAPNVDE